MTVRFNPEAEADLEEEDEVARCRRMREEFDRRFKSLDEMFDYCERLRRCQGLKTGKAPAKAKPIATNRKHAVQEPPTSHRTR